MTIPLALVSGFLGAGKTTFLSAYARRTAPRRQVVFLVNEFAQTDVDTPLLHDADASAVGVAGGSIFCRCKVTEFIRVLGEIPALFPAADGVVVETSGMSDPSAGRSLLDETGLHRTYAFQGTVTLVDPGTLAKVLDTMPAAERQVAAADVAVVTKGDVHPEADLAATEAAVRAINPAARIVRAVRGAIDLDPLDLHSQRWVDGEILPCATIPLVAVEVPCPAPVDAAAVGAAIAALGEGLFRAKGYLPVRDGWRFLDWSAGRLDLSRSHPGPPGLALIVNPGTADAARGLAERVRSGAFAA